MISLFSNLIQASVCMSILYGFYLLLMSGGTHFKLNRIFLLLIPGVSLAIAFINIPLKAGAGGLGANILLQTIQVNQDTFLSAENGMGTYPGYLYLYFAGLSFFLFLLGRKLLALYRIQKECHVVNERHYAIAWHHLPLAPFSFWHTIYLPKNLEEETHLDKILIHEEAHILQKHSLDILAMEVVCLLTWFNPVSWLIKFSLRETHEYLADSRVFNQINDTGNYFQLLMRSTFGTQPELTNSFNKSLTLKRLKMMKKDANNQVTTLKVLLVLPILSLLILSFSCKQVFEQTPLMSDVSVQDHVIVTSNSEDNAGLVQAPQDAPKGKVDVKPSFKGGKEKLTEYILSQVKYPEAARKKGIQGTVYVTYTVSKTGKVEGVKVKTKVDELLDTEAMRVISSMPDWNPGTHKGKAVDVSMTLPIDFKLGEK